MHMTIDYAVWFDFESIGDSIRVLLIRFGFHLGLGDSIRFESIGDSIVDSIGDSIWVDWWFDSGFYYW